MHPPNSPKELLEIQRITPSDTFEGLLLKWQSKNANKLIDYAYSLEPKDKEQQELLIQCLYAFERHIESVHYSNRYINTFGPNNDSIVFRYFMSRVKTYNISGFDNDLKKFSLSMKNYQKYAVLISILTRQGRYKEATDVAFKSFNKCRIHKDLILPIIELSKKTDNYDLLYISIMQCQKYGLKLIINDRDSKRIIIKKMIQVLKK